MTVDIIEKLDLFSVKTEAKIRADVVLGDCLNVLKNMTDNSVDLIVTSPPCA